MKYVICYLVIAGLFNPSVFFHKGMNFKQDGIWAYFKMGILLNLFGFLVVPFLTLTAYLGERKKRNLSQPKAKTGTEPSDDEILKGVEKNSQAFVLLGNETVH